MSELARVVEYTGDHPGKEVWTWCPGCDHLHPFTIEAPPGPNGDRLNNGVTWTWNGSLEVPTFSPSLLVYTSVHLCQHTYWACPAEDGGECPEKAHMLGYRLPDGTCIAPKVWEPVPEGAVRVRVHQSPHTDPTWGSCHSFLTDGRWQFLDDSAHRLAGQTVDMVPLKDRWSSDWDDNSMD